MGKFLDGRWIFQSGNLINRIGNNSNATANRSKKFNCPQQSQFCASTESSYLNKIWWVGPSIRPYCASIAIQHRLYGRSYPTESSLVIVSKAGYVALDYQSPNQGSPCINDPKKD